MAFAAGCAATWAFLRTTFTAPLRTRITELEGMVAAERKRCEAMETRLVQRIQQLEALLLTMSPGHLWQDFQRVLSEQRVDGRDVPVLQGLDEEGGDGVHAKLPAPRAGARLELKSRFDFNLAGTEGLDGVGR